MPCVPRKTDTKKHESACISTRQNNTTTYNTIGSSKAAGETSASEAEVESEEEASERKRKMSTLNKIKAEKMMDHVGIELEEKGYNNPSWSWSAERNGVDVLADNDKEVLVGEVTNFSRSSYLPPKRLRRYRKNLLEEAEKQRKLHPSKKVRMFFVYTYDIEHLDILTNEGIELWQRNEIKLTKFDYEEAGFFEDGEEPIITWEEE